MSDKEVFYEWVEIQGYSKFDPIDDAEHQKAMMGTLSFAIYLLRFRMRELFDKIFSKN